MNTAKNNLQRNPLATGKIEILIMKFAIPATLSYLVSALYNIVDQIFIGQSVGFLGNAATNVAFPLVTICTAIALLLGIGSASNTSLELGRGNKDAAAKIAGSGITYMIICGVMLALVVNVFLHPLMLIFGATEEVLAYSVTYARITSLGMPFLILSTGASQIIRADGSPKYAMISTFIGVILNCFLDPIFIFVLDMGIAGAALATVIGQIVSAIIVLCYLPKFKMSKLTIEYFKPKAIYTKAIFLLGMAACFNQLSMTVVQITMNNTLNHYGALSVYGSDIPIACVGVITKINVTFMAVVLGIAQGCQPIIGFNYGAKNYSRVKETYIKAAIAIIVISTVAFLCFQIFPRQLVGIFGEGSEVYFTYAERYFRIYMMLTFIIGIQPLTSNFFTSIGKAKIGIIISLTRQFLFLIPLILIFPIFFGIEGVMYAGPIADAAAAILAIYFVKQEFKKLNVLCESE